MDTPNTLFDIPKCESSEPNRAFIGKPRIKQAQRDQIEVQWSSLDQLLDFDHPVRQVWKYVESLDLSKTLNVIESVEGNAGRPAIDPKILVSLWLYATIEGIGSAYVLADYTKEHLAFKWICGGVSIERRTISQFRTDNGNLFDDLLAQGIAILIKADAVKIGEIAQDGLRVRAFAGTGSFRRETKIKELYDLAKTRIEKLKAELNEDPGACKNRQKTSKLRAAESKLKNLEEAKAEFQKYIDQTNAARKKHKKSPLSDSKKKEMRVSATDAEARIMKMADGGFRPAYNVQFAVDTKNNIIVGTDVVNAGTDGGQMLPMYEAIKKKYKKSPQKYLADGGFKNKIDIEQMTKNGCAVFMPVQENANGKRAKNPYKAKVMESNEMGQWRTRMGKEESKVVYKRRAATVELANANVRHFGLYQITVRGLNKVRGITNMFAVVYNMRRTISLGVI